jgi:pyrophosphatase PpaX
MPLMCARTTSDQPTQDRAASIEAVLFDLDGTLIDTVELILTSFRYATTQVLGAPLPDELLMRNVGVPLISQMREFSPEHADELLRVYREHNAAHHDAMARAYPGTEEVLRLLQTLGMQMGVVTSKGTTMTRRGLDVFGLGPFFDVVVTADDVDRHKPDPHPLEEAARGLGVDVSRCAYVGDSPHDMQAAIAAGAVSVAALWGAFPREAVLEPGPEFALDSIRDLPLLLAGAEERFRASHYR